MDPESDLICVNVLCDCQLKTGFILMRHNTNSSALPVADPDFFRRRGSTGGGEGTPTESNFFKKIMWFLGNNWSNNRPPQIHHGLQQSEKFDKV